MKRLSLLSLIFLINACVDQKATLQKFLPKDDDAFARRFIDLLRVSRYGEAESLLDTATRNQLKAGDLDRLHGIVDHGEPIAFETIGWNFVFFKPWNSSKTTRTVNLTYQLQFPDAWVLAEVVLISAGEGTRVSGVHFQPLPDSLEILNRFTFNGKGALHYVFFAACILIPLFMLFTAAICMRSRVRRRWLWIIFILIGLVQFQFNWSTEALNVQPIAVSLLGAGYWRQGLYAPWILKFAIPIGAIVFWILRSRLRRQGDPPSLPTPPRPPSPAPPAPPQYDY